jgi:hypothetical protein
MPFSAYGSDALRLLAPALNDALAILDKSASRDLTDAEKVQFRTSVARNLMDAYDAGERDPTALSRASLRGILVSPVLA